MRNDIIAQKEQIHQALLSGTPQAEIVRQLQCSHETLHRYLKLWGISSLCNPGRKGRPHLERRKSASTFLKLNGPPIHSHKLRIKILEEGIKEAICESCKNTHWLGKLIPLELHHINGNKKDNRLENLQMICPNCHVFTPTYKIKNARVVQLVGDN